MLLKDRVCVMVDDMVDTAGTLTEGAQTLVDHGARGVYAAIATLEIIVLVLAASGLVAVGH